MTTPSPSDLLDDLTHWADGQGVGLTVAVLDDHTWEVIGIDRDEGTPPGTGRLVLERLNRLADTHGQVLTLMVMGANSALETYYAALGYVGEEHRRDPLTADLTMCRAPSAQVVLDCPPLHRRPRPR